LQRGDSLGSGWIMQKNLWILAAILVASNSPGAAPPRSIQDRFVIGMGVPPAALGAASYDDHVAKFIRDLKPEVLSIDHYPLMRPEGDTRGAYCDNLECFRKHSLAAGIRYTMDAPFFAKDFVTQATDIFARARTMTKGDTDFEAKLAGYKNPISKPAVQR
jgi:hypothetical protein